MSKTSRPEAIRWKLAGIALLVLTVGSPTLAAGEQATPVTAEQSEDTLALVNGEPIRVNDVLGRLGSLHEAVSGDKRADFDLDRVIKRLVNDTLLAQEARAVGLDEDAAVRRKLARYRDDLIEREFERDEFHDAGPTDDEVRAYFDDKYRIVQLRTVSSYDLEGAEQMLADLQGGADMEQMAKERSVDPIAARGGLMKPAPLADLNRGIAALAAIVKIGDIGGPVRTSLGWSVFRLESRLDPDPERFEVVQKTIRSVLRQREIQARREKLSAKLRERYAVIIDNEVLKGVEPERQPDARLLPKVPDPSLVVATIGEDHEIRAREYAARLIERWKGVRNLEAAIAAAPIILDRMIERKLILAECERRKYGELPAVQQQLNAMESSLLVPKYLEEVVAAGIEIEREEMEAFYEANKDQYHKPPRVRLGQITLPTLEKAERVARQLRNGADLAWLAEQYSIDRFKADGGDRGWYEPFPGVDDYNSTLIHSKPGDVLDPFGAAENFVVVKVVDVEDQGVYPFQEISGNIREAVFSVRFRETLDLYLTRLRERSEIKIFDDHISALAIMGSVDDAHEPGGTPSGHGH